MKIATYQPIKAFKLFCPHCKTQLHRNSTGSSLWIPSEESRYSTDAFCEQCQRACIIPIEVLERYGAEEDPIMVTADMEETE